MFHSIDVTAIAAFSILPILVLGILTLRYKHRERLALIQYGKSAEIFSKHRENPNKILKWGLLLSSLGAGLLVGGIFDCIFNTVPLAAFSCIFLFGGLSLIYFHQHYTTSSNNSSSYKKEFKYRDEDDDDILI